MIDALNNPAGKELIESIEDMVASTDGAVRYAAEIAACVAELRALTGFQYTL